MTTPADPPTESTPTSRWRRFRPGGRGAVIGAVVVALLVVAGVVAAFLLPGSGPGHRGDRGPGFGLSSESDPLLGDGPGGRGRGPLHGLGDDTLLAGTVSAVGEGTLGVTPDGAPARTLRTDDDTRVLGPGDGALGDLAAGERVLVRVDGSGEAATAVAVWATPARAAGTVTALTGDTATVVRVDGLPVTADVAALAQRPAVGELVVVTGAADGTTLVADTVRVLPTAS